MTDRLRSPCLMVKTMKVNRSKQFRSLLPNEIYWLEILFDTISDSQGGSEMQMVAVGIIQQSKVIAYSVYFFIFRSREYLILTSKTKNLDQLLFINFVKCFQKVGLVFVFASHLDCSSSVTLPKVVKLSESELFVLRSIYQLSTNLETVSWQSFEASTLQTSPLSTSFPLPKKVTNGLFDCNPSKVKLYRAMEMLIFWIF